MVRISTKLYNALNAKLIKSCLQLNKKGKCTMVLKIDWKLIWLFLFKVGLDPIKHLGVGTLGSRGFVKIKELTSAKQDKFMVHFLSISTWIRILNLHKESCKSCILNILVFIFPPILGIFSEWKLLSAKIYV